MHPPTGLAPPSSGSLRSRRIFPSFPDTTQNAGAMLSREYPASPITRSGTPSPSTSPAAPTISPKQGYPLLAYHGEGVADSCTVGVGTAQEIVADNIAARTARPSAGSVGTPRFEDPSRQPHRRHRVADVPRVARRIRAERGLRVAVVDLIGSRLP